jgi:hypothetical protein
LSDFDFLSEDSSRSEEDGKVNYKKKECDFTGLCLMVKGRSLWNNFDSGSHSSFVGFMILLGSISTVGKCIHHLLA